MAQSRPAPAAGPVTDPGGPSWPLNGSSTPAPMSIGGSPSSPGVASTPIQRTGTSLPVNTPRTQPVPNVGGGFTAWRAAGPVTDPGATRLDLGAVSTIGYPSDRATPAGGDPGALGSSYVTTDADSPQWSQRNPNANPNPGALSGGMATAPTLYPGETPINQTSPNANPNPGAL